MHEIEMTVPQSTFLQLDAKFPLFVAGFGSGKSTTEIVSIFQDLAIPHYGVMKIGAYAPTYDLLKLITIPYLCEFLEEMSIGYTINKSDYIITLDSGDQIILRSLANPERIVGYQTFRAHIDEIDTLAESKAEDAWNKIIARNRQKIHILDEKGAKILRHDWEDLPKEKDPYEIHVNRVSAYTTPEGFRFAYNRWEKNPVTGYVKVKAATYSNPHLPDDYVDSLRATYPAGLIDAYIEGDFVNLTGKAVYPGFCRDKHNSTEEVRNGDILEIGMDFNVVHGAAVIHVLRDGNPIAVDEIHDSYDTDEQIKIIQERYPKHPINVYPDATGSKRTSSNTTESDIAKLRAAGFSVFCDHINPPIKDRVMSWNAMILNGKGEIQYRVNTEKCPHLTNSLEQQVWTENGVPDKSNGLDHIVDGGGYYVFYRFGITKPRATAMSTHARY
jgi:hypothetical protein